MVPPGWRNWQTQRTQNPPRATSWGFDPPSRHQFKELTAGDENVASKSTTPPQISAHKPLKGKLIFTSGSEMAGPSSFLIRRISRPVCTTELGYMARIEPEFAKRHTKLIGLSVDPVESHNKWAADIEETQGAAVKYPMIGDTDLAIATLYNMLPAEETGTSEGRTAATNATVRSVFIVGPDKKIKLMLTYPMTTGRNFDEILRVLDSIADDGETQSSNTRKLERWRRCHHSRFGHR